jgi:hypothetical protein
MALSILDGNQSATTLSTILSSGQHITAHTVVSLGTQAIADIVNATSAGLTNTQLRASAVTIAGTVTANLYQAFVNVGECGALEDGDGSTFGLDRNFPVDIMSSIPAGTNNIGGVVVLNFPATQPVSIASVTIGSALPAGTNRIGVVTIGGGTVTIGAGTSQIGSVTASINGTVPISISSVTVGNSVTIGSLPAISGTVTVGVLPALTNNTDFASVGTDIAEGINNYGTIPVFINSQDLASLPVQATCVTSTNRIGVVTIGAGTVTLGASTAQIGSVTASISNSVVTFYPLQGTTVSSTNFTSTTPSTTLVSAVAGREVLTVFNEGSTLYISPGATCTTISYQVRLSAGDYWECPAGQLSLAHTAVFATAGTARVTQVS